ncbi:MAG: hypothetical protein V1872_08570 [bacterium]
MKYKTELYDPTWLVNLAKKEYLKEIWLYEELKKCTQKLLISDDPAMIYFVNPANPNELNSEWQHETCIVLRSYKEGDIVIDILKGNKIGGIEQTWLID